MTTVNVGYTSIPGFPAGSQVVKVTAAFAPADGSAPTLVDVTPGATQFDVTLPPGDYVWTLNNDDAAGNTFGGPFSGKVSIPAGPPVTVSLSLASSLSFP